MNTMDRPAATINLNGAALKFYPWLMRQRGRDDPVGDIAADAANDREAPKSIQGLRRHLHSQNACPGAIKALERAIKEWRASLTSINSTLNQKE